MKTLFQHVNRSTSVISFTGRKWENSCWVFNTEILIQEIIRGTRCRRLADEKVDAGIRWVFTNWIITILLTLYPTLLLLSKLTSRREFAGHILLNNNYSNMYNHKSVFCTRVTVAWPPISWPVYRQTENCYVIFQYKRRKRKVDEDNGGGCRENGRNSFFNYRSRLCNRMYTPLKHQNCAYICIIYYIGRYSLKKYIIREEKLAIELTWKVIKVVDCHLFRR